VATRKRPSERSRKAIDDFALALERGRFIDYIQQLQSTRTLLWKNFLTGLARGFGGIVGATVVVALVVAILSVLGDSLPGEIGDFFSDTSQQINPTH
jgi:uncharacterized protein DUF5665